jgi:hypothetical protein
MLAASSQNATIDVLTESESQRLSATEGDLKVLWST